MATFHYCEQNKVGTPGKLCSYLTKLKHRLAYSKHRLQAVKHKQVGTVAHTGCLRGMGENAECELDVSHVFTTRWEFVVFSSSQSTLYRWALLLRKRLLSPQSLLARLGGTERERESWAREKEKGEAAWMISSLQQQLHSAATHTLNFLSNF